MGFFITSKDMGVDLGTSNTLVYVKGKGILLSEPSVVALNIINKTIFAVGSEAKKMVGRTPMDIQTVRPLKDGVIADFDVAQEMLKRFIQKITKKKTLASSRVAICHPTGITEVEKRSINEAAVQAGARKVMLIEEPVAAAIGAGLPVNEPIGSMIIDIGGGNTEVAVISLGGVVTSKTLRIAGNQLDEAIINHIKKEYNLFIGEITAENIKIELGSVYYDENVDERTMQISGRDMFSGLPKVVTLTESEILQALQEPVALIIEAIRGTLEETAPELSADIMENGITLSGGGALLRGLDKLIYNKLHIPAYIAENPLECVVMGAGKCLDVIDKV